MGTYVEVAVTGGTCAYGVRRMMRKIDLSSHASFTVLLTTTEEFCQTSQSIKCTTTTTATMSPSHHSAVYRGDDDKPRRKGLRKLYVCSNSHCLVEGIVAKYNNKLYCADWRLLYF